MSQTVTIRQRQVLNAIIESYIATGEPVSSGALVSGVFAGVSSATIRNEMAALADAGLLDQPHTSAGRVPSAAAMRLYVNGLTVSAPRLPEIESRVQSSFAGVTGTSALLECSSRVLASLSSGVGVAVGAAHSTDRLEHIHFTRLTVRRVLAVVVSTAGSVHDRMLTISPDAPDLTTRELEAAAAFLNAGFRGWTLDSIRTELERRLEQERSAYEQLQSTVRLWSQTVATSADDASLFVDGVANLVHAAADQERLRQMLIALEEKQRLIRLLGAYMDSQSRSVRVVFDLAEQAPEMDGLVLITAPAHSGPAAGTLAILGPRRMDYAGALSAVACIQQLLSRAAAPLP